MKIFPICFQNISARTNVYYKHNQDKSSNPEVSLQNNKTVCTNQYLSQINFTSTATYNNVMQYFDKRIIGFTKEKSRFIKNFAEPFIESFKNSSIQVPNSVMLFGPEKRIVDCFADTAREIIYQNTGNKIFNLSNETNDYLLLNLPDILEQAKEYYNKTGKRTIIYLDNPEKFLSMTYNQAKRLVDFDYSEDDAALLKSVNNIRNIEYFKSLLDNCSSTPNSRGYATTFLFTSNSPHLLHPDLRRGKVDKFEIPRQQDCENANILSEYIQKCKDDLTNTQNYPDCFAEKIWQLEDLDKKSFTPENFSRINEICATDEQKGAFSLDDLYKTALTSCLKTLNPQNYSRGKEVLNYELQNAQRSFTPKMIIRQNKISNLVNNKPSLFKILCGKEELGIITDEEMATLNKLKAARQSDLI